MQGADGSFNPDGSYAAKKRNGKIDQIHRGLQIDRKRRQELQRKRLAMGHKPDDHEEQTFR